MEKQQGGGRGVGQQSPSHETSQHENRHQGVATAMLRTISQEFSVVAIIDMYIDDQPFA